jgi:hypothetical protein
VAAATGALDQLAESASCNSTLPLRAARLTPHQIFRGVRIAKAMALL